MRAKSWRMSQAQFRLGAGVADGKWVGNLEICGEYVRQAHGEILLKFFTKSYIFQGSITGY